MKISFCREGRGRLLLAPVYAIGFLLAFMGASPALANGRYPLATQLAIAPNDDAFMVMRSTFGILQSFDSGRSWTWICEKAVGYSDLQDPTVAISGDGTLLVAGDALVASESTARRAGVGALEHGCNWASRLRLPSAYIADLDADLARPERFLALAVEGDGVGGIINRVFESVDNGGTWAPTGGDGIGGGFIGLTLEVAGQDRIYVSGRMKSASSAALARSDDGGKTWLLLPVEAPGISSLFIAAVDPTNGNRVYARSAGDYANALLVTEDAGLSWRRIFSANGGILGFALSPDSKSVALGSPSFGVLVADVVDYQFRKTNDLGAYCLKWTQGGLYACGVEATDHLALGISIDRGATFSAVMHLASIAPLQCSNDSSVSALCSADWSSIATLIGAKDKADASSEPPDASAEADRLASSGCGCRTAGRGRLAGSREAFGLLLLGIVRICRRRSRRSYGKLGLVEVDLSFGVSSTTHDWRISASAGRDA